jgi:tRNA G18 (ribose-2'-O)-methylase SpoU
MDLKTLWSRAQEFAKAHQGDGADPINIATDEFQTLLTDFQQLSRHVDPGLQKIGRLAHIFAEADSAKWTQRQWLNLLVPLERYLDRRLTDSEILGFRTDLLATLQPKLPLMFIADHWRSAFNVGALFRLADGFGVQKIYLTGYTPTPDHPAVQKTSMGSSSYTPWEHRESTSELLQDLKIQNIEVWALETASEAQPLGDVELPSPLAIVLGNERFGLDSRILNLCEGTLKIPLRGTKNSMNVANCAGIFAFEWCRQNAK